MQHFKGLGPWITGFVVIAMAWGFVPRGVLAEHRDWFAVMVWVGCGVAALVIAAAGLRAWRVKGQKDEH